MNKKSRKYRKLHFIRRKNRLRLGELLSVCFKVVDSVDIDQLSLDINTAIVNQETRFKLTLCIVKQEIGIVDEDFAKSLLTVLLTLKH